MEPRYRSFPRAPFIVFLLLALGIVVAGGMIFRHETTRVRKATEEHLSSIANLKATQIAHWRRERLEDAESMARNPLNSLRIRPFLESPPPATGETISGTGWNRARGTGRARKRSA